MIYYLGLFVGALVLAVPAVSCRGLTLSNYAFYSGAQVIATALFLMCNEKMGATEYSLGVTGMIALACTLVAWTKTDVVITASAIEGVVLILIGTYLTMK